MIERENNYTVYIHTSPSLKSYIGITGQKLNERWRNGNGYPNNNYFTYAIKKYGWDNFEHIIIASNITKEEACNFEVLLIEKLHTTNRKYGYNISSGGENGNPYAGKTKEEIDEIRRKISESCKGLHSKENNPMWGKHLSEETRKKMSDLRKGEKHHLYGKCQTEETKEKIRNTQSDGRFKGENNPMAKSVICIINKEIFSTARKAGEKYNVGYSNIGQCCLGKVGSAGKHPDTKEILIWMYYDDYIQKTECEVDNIIYLANINTCSVKQVKCITTGEIFSPIMDAERKYGISSASITNCCKNKLQSAGKHPITNEKMTWMYYETDI